MATPAASHGLHGPIKSCFDPLSVVRRTTVLLFHVLPQVEVFYNVMSVFFSEFFLCFVDFARVSYFLPIFEIKFATDWFKEIYPNSVKNQHFFSLKVA